MSANLQTVYVRTEQGDAELAKPSNGLSLNQRKLLQWADGQATVAALAERLAAGHTVGADKVIRDIDRLEAAGLLATGAGIVGAGRTQARRGKRKSSGMKWLVIGLVVLIAIVLILLAMSGRRTPLVQPNASLKTNQLATEDDDSQSPSVLGSVSNPARWFSPSQPKPAELKPTEVKSTVPKVTPTLVAKPLNLAATPVPTPIPTPVPTLVTVVATRTPTPVPTTVTPTINRKPIYREQPEFPTDVESTDSGHVRARMTVESNGRVSHVEVLESKPRHIFDLATVTALSHWRFAPSPSGFTEETDIVFKAE